MSQQKTRIEKDALGTVEIPSDALYGINTARAINNFDFSLRRLQHEPAFIRALNEQTL